MAGKKTSKGGKKGGRTPAEDEASAAQAVLAMIAKHEQTIRDLARVVVNLHANVQALRDVVEPLGAASTAPRVARPLRALRRVTLDE